MKYTIIPWFKWILNTDFFNYKFALSLVNTLVFIILFPTLTYSQTDQNLIYASYHGGIGDERPRFLEVFPDGSSIVAGSTESFNLPTTDDAYQGIYQGQGDIFISRFDANGALIYSTFIGGNNYDSPYALKIKNDGGYILAGRTLSENFPISEDAPYQEFYEAMYFIASFDPDNNLLWSSFVAGEGLMTIQSLDIDAQSNIYISGGTTIPGLGTPGVHQETFPDASGAAYIAKVSATGEHIWLTYFYGNNSSGFSSPNLSNIALSQDASMLYVAGHSDAIEGLLLDAHQDVYGGGIADGFISSFNAESGSLNWATYYGGMDIDSFTSTTVGENGTLFLVGETASADNISTPGAHQTSHAGSVDHFLVAFQPDGTRLWGTYFGGNSLEAINPHITLTSTSVLATGITSSQGGIVHGNPLEDGSNVLAQSTTYLAKFTQDSGSLEWGSYFLGFCNGYVTDIETVNNSRFIGVGHMFSSCNEILTEDAHQNFHGGALDMGFFIFDDMTVSTNEVKYAPLSVHPNPTSDFVQIALPEGVDNHMQMQVFDLQGRMVMEQAQFNNGGMLNVSSLPQAVYVLIGKTKDAAFRQKLVVTR